MRSLLYFIACCVALLLSGLFVACDTLSTLQIPGSSESPDMGTNMKDIIPASKVGKLAQGVGDMLYDFALSGKENLITKDPEIVKEVDGIFESLKAAALQDPKYQGVTEDFTWRTTVIHEETVQASAYTGGGIIVYQGVFPYADRKAGLAAILAHEMVHVLEGHGVERFKKYAAATSGVAIAAAAASGKLDPELYGPMAGALGVGYLFGVKKPFELTDESEADCTGLKIAARAGYNPESVMKFWEDFSADDSQNDSSFFNWFDSHLPDKERAENLRSNCAPDATNLYTSLNKSEQKDGDQLLVFNKPPSLK